MFTSKGNLKHKLFLPCKQKVQLWLNLLPFPFAFLTIFSHKFKFEYTSPPPGDVVIFLPVGLTKC